MKLSEIQDLIKFVARAGVNEVEIEQKDFKILIILYFKNIDKHFCWHYPVWKSFH